MDTPRSDPHTELTVADTERRRLLDRLRESEHAEFDDAFDWVVSTAGAVS